MFKLIITSVIYKSTRVHYGTLEELAAVIREYGRDKAYGYTFFIEQN